MSASELLITVVIVTALVTLLLIGVTYLSRRSAARGAAEGEPDRSEGSRYFVRYCPGSDTDSG